MTARTLKRQGIILIVLLLVGCSRKDGSNAVSGDNRPKWTKIERPLAVFVLGGYATVEGFWQSTSSSDGKQLVSPIAVKISCDRSEKICRELDATVQFGVLKPESVEYQITSWTAVGIVADDSDEGACGIGHRLVIDFKSNSVTVTDYPKRMSSSDLCKPYQDANSYALHGGNLAVYPPPAWSALGKPEGKP